MSGIDQQAILRLLKSGEMSVAAIAVDTGRTKYATRSTLRQLRKKNLIIQPRKDIWSLNTEAYWSAPVELRPARIYKWLAKVVATVFSRAHKPNGESWKSVERWSRYKDDPSEGANFVTQVQQPIAHI